MNNLLFVCHVFDIKVININTQFSYSRRRIPYGNYKHIRNGKRNISFLSFGKNDAHDLPKIIYVYRNHTRR